LSVENARWLGHRPKLVQCCRRFNPCPRAGSPGSAGGHALLHQHRKQYKDLREYFDAIDGKPERLELNLYITGYEDEPESAGAGPEPVSAAAGADDGGMHGAPGPNPNKPAATEGEGA